MSVNEGRIATALERIADCLEGRMEKEAELNSKILMGPMALWRSEQASIELDTEDLLEKSKLL